ncbi:MAG: PKD domain-containing protein, partial [Planctomycetes bacterium]|nr:PKD domain-containing protein [Planctomycetota bacterium]
DQAFTKTFTVSNPSRRDVTGLAVSLLDGDPDDDVAAELLYTPSDVLRAGASMALTVKVTAPPGSPDKVAFHLVVQGDDDVAASAYLNVELFDRPPDAVPPPRVKLSPNEIDLGLAPGGLVSRTIRVENTGMGPLTDMHVTAPELLTWVSITPPPVADLPPGESTVFDVVAAPPETVEPGIYTEQLALTDGSGRYGAAFLLKIEVSTATRGAVTFRVVDDSGQPVTGASIRLVGRQERQVFYGNDSVSTYHPFFQLHTDERGVATAEDVSVDTYDYSVTAPGFDGVRDAVDVMPLSEAEVVDVVLHSAPLTYKWTVTPIVIEDTYEITLDLTFAAQVPRPTFSFLPPWVSIPHHLYDGLTDQIIIVNPSLVEINTVMVRPVGVEGMELSGGGLVGTISPQSSAVVAYHLPPGDYDYLGGGRTYFEVTGTYVEFDPVTFELKESPTELTGTIPLVNPSRHEVTVTTNFGQEEELVLQLPELEGGGDSLLDLFGPPMGFGGGGLGGGPVTEVVTVQLSQTATLEREGFDCHLELTSGMGEDMVGLAISPRVTDESGRDVTDRFYQVPPELSGIAALDGSANLPAYGSMDARWILIPGEGLGGTHLEGKKYYVKAVMSYYAGGRLHEVVTDEVEITVHPQPKLYLHYYIPQNVQADTPFKLGLLVENDGDGMARNLKIASGQPEIIDNASGLAIGFQVVGTSFGYSEGDVFTLVLGDVQPHSSTHGYWVMTSTLDGQFIAFKAELTHKAYKGIEINPLILDVYTEIIERDFLFADAQDPNNSFSLIDRDGDGFPDYLINLYTGLHLPVMIPQNVQVTRPLSEQDRTMDLLVPETAGYVCIVLPDPAPQWNYRAVVRRGEDGREDRLLSGNNFWRDHGNIYFIDELGYVDEQGVVHPQSATYMLDFRSALAVEDVQVTPNDFDILWSDEGLGLLEEHADLYEFTAPAGDSAVGRYALKEPLFGLADTVPPTEGHKCVIRATITNDGVLPESGTVEFYVTDPQGTRTLLDTLPVNELSPWRHVWPTVEWTPQSPGRYVLTAHLPGDSPDGEMSITVDVNALPFADAGADFFSSVAEPTIFDGTRSVDADGYLRTLSWDFGDGTWAGGMTPAHVYEDSGTYRVHLVVKDDDGFMSEDVMQVTIRETRPDLLVDGISVQPDHPTEGQQVTVTATIRNAGVGDVGPGESFLVGFYVDGRYGGLVEIDGPLGAGESIDVPVQWTTAAGNHQLTFVADDMEDRIDEANEDNNRQTRALYPEQLYWPDLVVDDVVTSVAPGEQPPWGRPITLTAHVRNAGTADAGKFRCDFYIDGKYAGFAVVDSLPHEDGSNVADAPIQWLPAAGVHVVEVMVDHPLSHVVESDETNNAYSGELPALTLRYPDLEVTNFELWPSDGRVQPGEPMVAYGTIRNDSDVPIP